MRLGDRSVFPRRGGMHIEDMPTPGLTVRELFAALALQGLLAGRSVAGGWPDSEVIAGRAAAYADDLLKRLET